jgi:hypothetical protein
VVAVGAVFCDAEVFGVVEGVDVHLCNVIEEVQMQDVVDALFL